MAEYLSDRSAASMWRGGPQHPRWPPSPVRPMTHVGIALLLVP